MSQHLSNEQEHDDENCENCNKVFLTLKGLDLNVREAAFLMAALKMLEMVSGEHKVSRSLARKLISSTVKMGDQPFDVEEALREFDHRDSQNLMEKLGKISAGKSGGQLS